MENRFFPNRRLRLAVQTGIPLILLALYWNVVQTLTCFGRAILLPPAPPDCSLTPGALFQAGLTVGYGLLAYFGVRYLVLVLVSQFALPVETWDERRMAVQRLLAYTSGRPGPALSVRDGQLVARREEQLGRRGPAGVVLVDSSSEVVLQTDTEYVGTRGPGVVFTRGGQQVIPLDMRKQRRTQEKVKALTRDGLEVTADITVTFALDSGETQLFRDWRDPDRPPYRSNPSSAYKAVYGKAVDARYKDVAWSDLPTLVAADVWRDLLIQRDLESLFSRSQVGAAPLEALQEELTARLKPPPGSGHSAAFSHSGDASAGEGTREYQVLEARGIRVISASINRFALTKPLEEQRIRNWQDNWQQRASERAARTDPVIAAKRDEGRLEAQITILNTATEGLRKELGRGNQPGLKVTLQLLLRATQGLNREAALYGEGLSSEQPVFDGLETWAAGLPFDGRGGGDGAGTE